MLEVIVKHGIIFYAMGIMMVLGIFAKVISHLTVRKVVAEASEIQKSNHRLMRLIKSKFEHASMVSDKVQNVKAFVKKYLYEYKVFGMKLDTWRGLQRKTVWLLTAFGLLGIFMSYLAEGMTEQTFQYISWTGILTVILSVVHIITDETTKLEAAENYIVDYLENVCIHRYEKVNQNMYQAAKMEVPEVEIEKETEVEEKSKERAEQEKRIRAILEEFLA